MRGGAQDQGRKPARAVGRRGKLPYYIRRYPAGKEKNMDADMMAALVQLIGSLGFPIAMCVYMTVVLNKTLASLDDRLLSLSVRVDTLLDTLSEKEIQKHES